MALFDVVFFDGGEKEKLAQYIHQIQPKCLVTRGEMETPEQKLPKEPMPGPWESCFTLGSQWQFKPTNEVYKTGGKLIKMLIENRAKGGNLLINVGPEPSGVIPFEQERVFRELGLVDVHQWRIDSQHPPLCSLRRREHLLHAVQRRQSGLRILK